LAAELQDAFGVDAELVPGSGGAFEVTVDDTLVFSKHNTGRFPQSGEVVRLIKAT
jgi:selenoprotein W-related protein